MTKSNATLSTTGYLVFSTAIRNHKHWIGSRRAARKVFTWAPAIIFFIILHMFS